MKSLKKIALFIVFIIIVVVGGKLTGWSPLNLIFGPQYEVEKKQTPKLTNFWWISEYPAFIKTIDNAPKKILTASFKTGPYGHEKVSIDISKNPKKGLILEMKLPKEALFRINEESGKKIPTEINPIVTIRDHNLDGIPDNFYMKPGKPAYEEQFTKDGFIKFRNSPDHQAILSNWSIGIGFSINHFIYGIDSALPRQQ